MATTAQMIGGAGGAIIGGAFGGPAGASAGYNLGSSAGSLYDQLKGNEYQKTYDKQLSDQLKKIRMGQTLAPTGAEVQQATMGAQQQAMAAQQQQQADLQRSAAMGGANQGAYFAAQQQLGQATTDAVARQRMANEMSAQAIGEIRQRRALDAAKIRGAEMTAQTQQQSQTPDMFKEFLAPGETSEDFAGKLLSNFSGS